MRTKTPRATGPAPPRPSRPTIATAAWLFTIFTAAALPLVASRAASDVYRMPKELALRGSAIVLLALFGLYLTTANRAPIHWRDRVYGVAATAVAWTAITAAASTHHVVSFLSLLWVMSCAVIFIAAYALGERGGAGAINALLITSAVGAVSCFQQSAHFREGGLFGNAHDAAMQLAVAGIAALAVAASARAGTRWLALACAVVILIGLVATRTVGALVAFVAGAFVLLLLALEHRHRRYALIISMLLVAALFAWAPLRARVAGKVAAILNGDLDSAISGRSLPFVAAWRMARDHPLLGVGPGGFAREYFAYKVQIQDDTPSLARVGSSVYNFGEAHNDHLQTLAQLGVPGYLLALTALGLLGSSSRATAADARDGTENVRRRVARLLALPLVVTFAVAGLSGFPQSLAAPMTTFLFLAGLSLAWSRERTTAEVATESA